MARISLRSRSIHGLPPSSGSARRHQPASRSPSPCGRPFTTDVPRGPPVRDVLSHKPGPTRQPPMAAGATVALESVTHLQPRDPVDLGTAHVVAASIALALGLALLARRKGDSWHVRLGRLYLATMLAVAVAVAVPVLFVYDITGRPGPFPRTRNRQPRDYGARMAVCAPTGTLPHWRRSTRDVHGLVLDRGPHCRAGSTCEP